MPRIRWALVAAAVGVPLLLGTSGLLLSREFERGNQLQDAAQQSYERRAHLQTVLSLHQDIEIGQRGYVLTGDKRFLEPQERAWQRIDSELRGLERVLAAKGALHEELERLKAASAAKLWFVDVTVGLQRRGEGAEATALIAKGSGKAYMDEIRAAIAAMDRLERQQLQHRVALADRANFDAQRFSLGLVAALALLLGLSVWLVSRSMAEKQSALFRVRDLSARQSAILDGAKDGIIMINPSGSIETLNPAAAHLYGYEREELISRDIGRLFEVAPDAGHGETFLARLGRRHQGKDEFSEELWGKRRDGSTFPIDVAMSSVDLDGGKRYVAIVRDITERKQIERMKTEFVSTVSHELRTPLTSIAGSLGLLAGGAAGELPDRAKRLIGIAHSNSERLVRLINDILDIEKIESGKTQFEMRPVPLRPLFEAAIEANAAYAAEHGVSLGLGSCPVPAMVMGDSDRLMQVLTNLLSNASKFSPRGASVTLAAVPLDRGYRIVVEDRGSGVPSAFRGRIFDKFAQADGSDTRAKGGTGLGLSIAKEIVERHGGSIGFKDRKDGGTVFLVDLPSAGEAQDSAQQTDAGEGLPHILHLDDDPDVARVVAEAFEGKARLHPARSLADARAAVGERRFDLAVLDIALADGSGIDFFVELRRSHPDLPAIFFSAQEPEAGTDPGAPVLVKSRASLTCLVGTCLDLAAAKPVRKAA